MPKTQRLPSGSYRIRFTDPSGRVVSITRKTAADCRAAYRKALGDIARGEYTDPRKGRVTFSDWCDLWLAGARNLGTGGRDTYRRDLDRHILPALGKIPVGKLSAGDLDVYLTRSLETSRERTSRPLAASTVHRHYRTIHRALAVAVERGLIPKNPADKVQPPKVPKREVTVLSVEQIDALADAITARYRAWVFVAAYGGLRWSETVGLRRGRVRFDELVPESSGLSDLGVPVLVTSEPQAKPPTHNVNPQTRPHGCRLVVVEQLVKRASGWERCEPKAGSKRTVTLPAFAAAELADHIDTYSLEGPDGLVFPTRNGTPPQAPSWTQNTFRRALAKAGLPPMRVHDLRHCAVSLALDVGANPLISQARAGHSSAQVHQDVYGHLMAGADQAVADALDALRAESRRKRLRAV